MATCIPKPQLSNDLVVHFEISLFLKILTRFSCTSRKLNRKKKAISDGTLKLSQGERFSTQRVAGHWNRLSKEMMTA